MKELIKSIEEKYKKIIDLSNDGIFVIDQEGRIEFANKTATLITGYSLEDLEGMEFRNLFLSSHIEHIEKLRKEISNMPIEGRKLCTEAEIVSKIEEKKDVEICLAFSKLGAFWKTFVYVRDIGERTQIEKELRKANHFLNKIIQSSVDAIIAVDMKGWIIIFNQGAERILGYKAEEVIHKIHITELYAEGEAYEIMKKLRSEDYGGVGKLATATRVTLIDKSGQEVPANLSAAIIYDEDGNEMASVGIFTDLREKLTMERELKEAQLQLIQSDKMASLGKLAAGVAHEINNPLGGILMLASMLLEEASEEDPAREDLKHIVEQTLRCKEIVKGLLEFSRQSRDDMSLFDIKRCVMQAISLLHNQSIFKDITIVQELDEDLPYVYGDASQINQVFINLMVNAADAMEGQGTLTIRGYKDEEEPFIKIDFIDTGCGIPEEHIEQIFEPFFTTKPVGKGTGLGLATSYGIIKKHGGEITVKSRVGEGTTFTVTLPIKEDYGTN